ncbi:uncharacterized protein DEA37_0011483, partial [Paragonimus westermani]
VLAQHSYQRSFLHIVSLSICNSSVSSFSCFGHVVDNYGFKPHSQRLTTLVNAPSPIKLHELRSVLGALQYYSRFIPNFAQCATSLFEVLSINNFSWSTNHEKTFCTLLRLLQTTESVLSQGSFNCNYRCFSQWNRCGS